MKIIPLNEHDIRLYGENNDLIYFDDWLINVSNWGASQETVRNHLICTEEYSEDMVFEKMNELEEQFYDYCNEYGYDGETV